MGERCRERERKREMSEGKSGKENEDRERDGKILRAEMARSIDAILESWKTQQR